jgi:ABC-type nitrate/sulfonate/bicarbonate transport system permease component
MSSKRGDVAVRPRRPVPGGGGGAQPAARDGRLWRRLRKWNGRGTGLLAVAVVIGLWQWYGDTYPNALYLFSTPSAVASSFGHIVANLQLPKAFGESLGEELVGFAIAAVIAIGVGTAMGRVKYIEFTLDPLVTLGIATPVVVLLPVMEEWFGFGYVARVSFITVLAVWPLLVNTWIGVRNMSATYELVGRSLRLGRAQLLGKVVLPAAAPYIFAGLRLSLAMATLGMVLAGQEVGDAGLGGLTEIYGQQGEVGQLVAAIISATALALLLFAMLRVCERRFFSWIADISAGA